MYRTKNLGELRMKNVGEQVELSGWVQKIRNLGAMIFIDLRDEDGITQVVVNDEKLQLQAKEIVKESCIHIGGKVVERTSKNPKMSTGDIEVIADKIEILGKCKENLPFEINSDIETKEDLRLEYRFLDLRNEKLHNSILFRAKVLKYLRDKMEELGFPEIQTPILANSSPEGARDYLVPSRINPGEFYALPQAPQQFKQLLMVSGFNKYFQIAPCFRDEDPRADRAPGEFYQLDFEMAFATIDDVLGVIEKIVVDTFKHFTNWKVDEAPFVRIPYKEAMEKFGIDKPDLRNPLIIQDATILFKNTEFNAFKDKTIKIIVVPNGGEQGRKFFDKMTDFATSEEVGAKGLAWTKINAEKQVEGGIAKFITNDIKEKLINDFDAKENSSIFFIADEFKIAQKIAGLIRIELGKRLDLIEKNVYKFCFVVDFPMYELTDDGKIDFGHNPFSMPHGGLEALNTQNPLDIVAYQFDWVCNGLEMASGAVRNHDPEIMIKAFEIAGYTKSDVETRFGALFNAFQYGTPPHSGAAPGIDRMVMLLENSQNIREVIAFPKNKKARDLLMGAPSKVAKEQLDEVHIKVIEE